MESYLTMTQINDFIFCPRSIFFHNYLQDNFTPNSFRETPQLKGLAAHQAVDEGRYSSSRNILQGTMVYSSRYRLLGRIDTFDLSTGRLCERKYAVSALYDGFRYQLYAQYFALSEMGYTVHSMCLYSVKDNRSYAVPLPGTEDIRVFERVLSDIRSYEIGSPCPVNLNKCRHCNYREICDLFPEEERL